MTMETIFQLALVLAAVSLVLGIVKRLVKLALLGGLLALVCAAVMTGVLPLLL